MRFTDYYSILGIDPEADRQAIKSAYRRLARRYHPDVAKAGGAAKKFLLIQEAYEMLSDPERREQYDRTIASHGRWQPSTRQPAPRVRKQSAFVARPSRPRREGRFVLNILGIRIDAGFGKN